MLVVPNYGCMFPGSSCHTWTETNGNTPRQTRNIGHCPLVIPNRPMHLNWHARWSWNRAVWGFLQYFTQITFGNEKKKGQGTSVGFPNYMGACFQAPHTTPGQRRMEMHHVH